MRAIYIILVAILSFLNAQAQSNKFIPNPNLDKYVGTWKAQIGNKKITLILKKTVSSSVNGVVIELLEGYHLFKSNDQIVDKVETKPTLKYGTSFSDDGVNHEDKLYFDFHDNIKHKVGKVILTLSKSNPQELTFNLTNSEVSLIGRPKKSYDYKFTLPTQLIFIKQ